ncbi:MAG: phospholipase D-like domain-containing protein [Balneolales bacterium]|nr:phospholipase D-like domain-containing protein [Balneolales bacterium]
MIQALLRLSIALSFVMFPVWVQAQLFENFESGTKGGYAAAPVDLTTGTWLFDDALLGTAANDRKNGLQSARIRDGFIRMEFDYPNGMSEVSFFAANSGFSGDTGGIVQVSYSTNGGGTWQNLGDPIVLTAELVQYSIDAEVPGNVRLRFARTAGNRINVDDVRIVDFVETNEEPTLNVSINDEPFETGGSYNFGTTTGSAQANFRVRNTGQEDLVITGASFSGDPVFSVNGDLNITLETLQSQTFSLMYSAPEPGVYDGELSFQTNDPETPVFTLSLSGETLDTSAPLPIAEARQLPAGTVVTVAGRVTVSNQFAGPVYFQDDTAGMAWYSDAIMRQEWLVGATIGDSLVVTGEIGAFNNLLQIVNHTSFEVVPESNQPVEPLDITLEQLNSGNFESQLVRITDVNFAAGGVFSGGTNYDITDPTASGQLRVDNFTNIGGTNIPNSEAEVVGVAGRFLNTRQILPRFTTDITVLSGPVILTSAPYEVSATTNSITFEWVTENPGHSEIRYGLTRNLEFGAVVDEEHKTEHSITLSGLEPAMRYKLEIRSGAGPDTSATNLYISSTRSPQGSTGEILTFFNKSVATELATFQEAVGNVDFSERLIEMINAAEVSAEFAFYSISGAAGNAVADAIIAAHNRGVDVRVIQSGHTGNTNAVVTRMANNGVRAVQSLGLEQMHNKFAIIDAWHEDYDKAWVITSSWNATDQGTNQQFQNMLNIQDVALARAYWYEFNQMWGADFGNFSPSNARFSENKEVVNPSVFWIGDEQVHVQLYFSPQGSTESQINRALTSAQNSIDLGLNLLTRRSISNTMLSRFNQGVAVRGVLGQITGQGSEWDYLSSWADVHHFEQSQFGLLHHKYGIVDGEMTSNNSKVITGSHNWSANANFFNDENTLIIRNERVANEFFQEFAARYWQAGGQETFNVGSVDISDPDLDIPIHASLSQNYPNPFNPMTNIQFELPQHQQVTLQVFDVTGRVVATLLNNQPMQAGLHTMVFDGSRLASGVYLYRLQLDNGRVMTRKMTLIK